MAFQIEDVNRTCMGLFDGYGLGERAVLAFNGILQLCAIILHEPPLTGV